MFDNISNHNRMMKVTRQAALEYHKQPKPGKIETVPTKPHATQYDLALAYSPGVAYPCQEIEKDPSAVYDYTIKGNLIGVVSNCTAVLGLGDIGPLAGKPVMEGKALLFKIFAGLDCFDIEVDEKDPARMVDIVRAISPTFGGINLEDIKAPECFEIERRLKAECDIPVMHDDQHGTAIISAAALLNALEIQGKRIQDIHMVVNGAGAAAVSCTLLYEALGVRRENIVMCDSKGVISDRRTGLSAEKAQFATARPINTLAEAMKDADLFLGLSVKDVVTPEMLLSMAPRPIVFALANPDSEIAYDVAKATREDMIFATGRSDYPNQINNVLGFPYIFRGALDCGAKAINEEMKLAAVHAIADLAKEPVPPVVCAAYSVTGEAKAGCMVYGSDYILPKPMDPRLLTIVAPAVAKAAAESGVARRPIKDFEQYREHLANLQGVDNTLMRRITEEVRKRPSRRVVFGEANTDNMLAAAVEGRRQNLFIPVLLGNEDMIAKRAERLGLDIEGIEIVNPRHDREADRRNRYAARLAKRRERHGMTLGEAEERMFDRNYFGMMMVAEGDADAFLGGTLSAARKSGEIAVETVGIKPGYNHFAAMHIVQTRQGVFFIADTQVNRRMDAEALFDISRLADSAVRYFAENPVMAMVSYSDFGSADSDPEPEMVRSVVERLHTEYPAMDVDGEMSLMFAFDRSLRDRNYPFNRLAGKQVNTLVFPNLAAAGTAYRMMRTMGPGEAIGPIQVGLNKSIHYINVNAEPRDILHLATIAALDSATRLDNRD